MVEGLRAAFKELVEETDWMDGETQVDKQFQNCAPQRSLVRDAAFFIGDLFSATLFPSPLIDSCVRSRPKRRRTRCCS